MNLAEPSARLQTWKELAHALLDGRDPAEMAEAVLTGGMALMAADGAVLMLGVPEDEDYQLFTRPAELQAAEPTWQRQAVALGNAATARHWETSRIAVARELVTPPFEAALAFPLRVRKQWVGHLSFLRHAGQPRFSAADEALGDLVASQVALACDSLRSAARLEAETIADDLTGVFSRSFLIETLRQQLKRLGRQGMDAISCIVVEVDQLPMIRQQIGKVFAAQALREIGQAVRAALRESDVVARLPGDGFVVLLPQTDGEGARVAARKMQEAVAGMGSLAVPVTLSQGLATYAFPGLEEARRCNQAEMYSHLLFWADQALSEARQAGGNRVQSYQAPAL